MLTSFLQKHKVKKGDPYTHGSMVTPRSSFYIKDDDDMKKFWKLYCSNQMKTSDKEIIGITEKPEAAGPLRIDFDFKFSMDVGKKRRYTQKHVEDIIFAYQNIISNVVDPEDMEDELLYCVVLEKTSARVENGVIKDGFHIHFPHFICNQYMQDVFIRNKIMDKLENSKEFEDFRKNVIEQIIEVGNVKLTLTQQIEKAVDPIYTKNWLMYGSVKDEKLEPWVISKCYDESLEETTLKKIFGNEIDKINDEHGKSIKPTFLLPRLLSIREKIEPIGLNMRVKEETTRYVEAKKQRRRTQAIRQERDMAEVNTDLKTIEEGKIMEMLSDYRADDYGMWMDVGWTLFNIGQGCDKALEMWIEFSKRSAKFQDGKCEEEWDKMEMRGKTLASLLFMAQHDNPDEYRYWKDQQLDTALYNAVSTPKPTHSGIAKVIHKKYEHKFVCADSKRDIWYEYHSHRWHLVDNGISIIKLMPTEMVDLFHDFMNRLSRKVQREEDEEKNKKRRDRAYKIITELEQAPFCSNVLRMCKIFFYDGNFIKKMDENKDLIGFENGVYDLKQGIFRDGTPDDYITFTTGRFYQEYSQSDDDVLELEEYLQKVYVNPKLRNYFLDFICSCFQGGNRNKIFAVFTGEGDAGKSVIVKLLEQIFGDYCLNFPRETFIAGKGSSPGGARPDLARVRGKRIAFVKEIAKNEKLHIGMIKEMTGNDSFFARGLYEKGCDISPMFTLVLMCNEPPSIPAHDEPTWNRVRVLPHESCFPKANDPKRPIPEELEDQMKLKRFPRDPHLGEKIFHFAGPLTWLLLQRFKTYYKNGIYEPEEVTMSTKQYMVENNVYMQFNNERIEKVEIEEKKNVPHIKLDYLYKEFNNWYIENYPSFAKEKIGKGTFKREMSKLLGLTDDKSRWNGYKLKIEQIDESNDVGEVETNADGTLKLA